VWIKNLDLLSLFVYYSSPSDCYGFMVHIVLTVRMVLTVRIVPTVRIVREIGDGHGNVFAFPSPLPVPS